MNITHHPSPNFDDRPEGAKIDKIILHYTGMQTAKAAIDKLCDPAGQNRVSAHYVVNEDGSILRLVDEQKRAWHAGVSYWHGETGLNATSIGIEIINPGHEFGYVPFPQIQMDAVINLLHDIRTRHDIPPQNILPHSDIAPDRKVDPGEKFDWALLSQHGLSHLPTPANPPYITDIKSALAQIGYNPDISEAHLIRAFNLHYCGTLSDQVSDDFLAKLTAMCA